MAEIQATPEPVSEPSSGGSTAAIQAANAAKPLSEPADATSSVAAPAATESEVPKDQVTGNTDGLGNPVTPGANQTDARGPVASVTVAEQPQQTTTVAKPTTPTPAIADWRVRLQLAQGANYLYKVPGIGPNDLLSPLVSTDGVVFPYLPQINVSYRANYDPVEITHTNYKNYFYKNSSVDEISITADFTAQDTSEAKYMLAVIHFFKSVTKMFYGQDSAPRGGTPPPLCYLSGLGAYQFNNSPLLITNFAYNLPNDVDYIRTEVLSSWSGSGLPTAAVKSPASPNFFQNIRLKLSGLNSGGKKSGPVFKSTSLTSSSKETTYVPTKLQIQLTAVPVVTRADISKRFSLEEYATGNLTKKGIW